MQNDFIEKLIFIQMELVLIWNKGNFHSNLLVFDQYWTVWLTRRKDFSWKDFSNLIFQFKREVGNISQLHDLPIFPASMPFWADCSWLYYELSEILAWHFALIWIERVIRLEI